LTSNAIIPAEKLKPKPQNDDVIEAEVVSPKPVEVKPEPQKPVIQQVEKPAFIDAAGPDSDETDKKRTAHIIVDDPGVDESKASQKPQSGLRLF